MPQHTENWGGIFLGKQHRTKISIPSLSRQLPEAKWCIWDGQGWGSIRGIGNLRQFWWGQGHIVRSDFFLFFLVFFCAVVCFDRSLFSSLCLLMSTVEPTEEGTTPPKRNKEATRSATGCLQWATGEGVRTTHEVILLCSSLPGVARCTPLRLVLGFAAFVAFGRLAVGYPPPPTA